MTAPLKVGAPRPTMSARQAQPVVARLLAVADNGIALDKEYPGTSALENAANALNAVHTILKWVDVDGFLVGSGPRRGLHARLDRAHRAALERWRLAAEVAAQGKGGGE